MSTIIDPELTFRIGSLDPDWIERIENYATAAFIWRGLRETDALHVSRALHWQAAGRDPAAPSEEILSGLALHPLAHAERERLAMLLDLQCVAEHGSRSPVSPGAARLAPSDYCRAGRRIAHALALLHTVEHVGV